MFTKLLTTLLHQSLDLTHSSRSRDEVCEKCRLRHDYSYVPLLGKGLRNTLLRYNGFINAFCLVLNLLFWTRIMYTILTIDLLRIYKQKCQPSITEYSTPRHSPRVVQITGIIPYIHHQDIVDAHKWALY